ncbi:hypothetical protein J6P92_02585 [bacterium]|nr:hypothetical protein [bacterium]
MKSIFILLLNGKEIKVSKSEFLDCLVEDEQSTRLNVSVDVKDGLLITTYIWDCTC